MTRLIHSTTSIYYEATICKCGCSNGVTKMNRMKSMALKKTRTSFICLFIRGKGHEHAQDMACCDQQKDGSAESAVTARYEAPGRAQGAFKLT